MAVPARTGACDCRDSLEASSTTATRMFKPQRVPWHPIIYGFGFGSRGFVHGRFFKSANMRYFDPFGTKVWLPWLLPTMEDTLRKHYSLDVHSVERCEVGQPGCHGRLGCSESATGLATMDHGYLLSRMRIPALWKIPRNHKIRANSRHTRAKFAPAGGSHRPYWCVCVCACASSGGGTVHASVQWMPQKIARYGLVSKWVNPK